MLVRALLVFFIFEFSFTANAMEIGPEPQSQVYGLYWSGHLENSNTLASHGKGFLSAPFAANRIFSSFGMIQIIEDSSSDLVDQYPKGDPVRIGDLSLESGGKIPGHDSHQNGLDADLFFLRTDHKASTDPLVEKGRIRAEFDLEHNWALIKSVVSSGRVSRIFVDPVIKIALCNYSKAIGDYTPNLEGLRRLRGLSGHEAHMHVRLTCPKESPACQPQQPDVPQGTGCDNLSSSGDENVGE